MSSISEQIELNRTQSIRLGSIEFGNQTNSNTIKWIVFDWLWETYTYKAIPAKAGFMRFFLNIEIFAILEVKATFLVTFYYAFEAYNPHAKLRAEVTRSSKIWF